MQISISQWKDFLQNYPDAHILQTAEWGELKSLFGWKAYRILSGTAGAQILFRTLPGGFTIAYIPKGPVGYCPELFDEIEQVCLDNKSIFLKIEPNEWEPWEKYSSSIDTNWHPSRPFQPRRTIMVNLEGTEEDILSRMKQKTRYNIRLAEKKGVVVKTSSNIDEFHRLALQTAERDVFGVHEIRYYQKVFELFHPTGQCELLTAYYQERPLASLFVMTCGNFAYYMYGASSNLERNRMPAYLIQWEAIKWSRAQGCRWYDLWGIPDLAESDLEDSFTEKESHDGLWGVYRFKRGFGGESWRSVGAWDRVYIKPLYWLYQQFMKIRGGGEG